MSRKTPSHQNFRKAWRIGETRGIKSWDQFEKYDSQSTLRQANFRENKRPSPGKKSKFLISEVPKLWNLRTDLKKRLKDKSDAPAARHGILPEIFTSSKRRTKLHSTHLRREFVVDSEASMHMVSKRYLNSAELETMETPRRPTTVMTANGEVQTKEEATVLSKNWTCSWRWCYLKKHPHVFHWGIEGKALKNTEGELYSEATLWKMILDLMQYSPNKDHQHLKWQQQKSWI